MIKMLGDIAFLLGYWLVTGLYLLALSLIAACILTVPIHIHLQFYSARDIFNTTFLVSLIIYGILIIKGKR